VSGSTSIAQTIALSATMIANLRRILFRIFSSRDVVWKLNCPVDVWKSVDRREPATVAPVWSSV
jgi:hypothetical protein